MHLGLFQVLGNRGEQDTDFLFFSILCSSVGSHSMENDL